MECILLALDGLEFTCVQVTRSICIVPCIFIIIIFLFVQPFSRNNLEPALAYASAIFNRAEISPCLSILSSCRSTTCWKARSTDIIGSFLLIQRPLSYHCTVVIESVFLTIDGLFFSLALVSCLNHLTIGLEVEPTALIFIFVECWCNLVIVGCIIICNVY